MRKALTGKALPATSLLVATAIFGALVACEDPKSKSVPPAAKAPPKVEAAPSAAPIAPAASTAAPVAKKPVECKMEPEVTFHMPGLEAEVRKKLAKETGPIRKEELAKIRSLNLTSVSIDDLDPCVFPYFTGVKDIFLGSGSLKDLSPLAKLPQLVSLRASINGVSDLKPLEHLVHLDRLDLGRTAVIDIAPLANLVELTELQLDQTQVTDLSPLAKCTRLQKLSIQNTPVKDLSPLMTLKQLKMLHIAGTPIDSTAMLAPLVSRGLKIISK